MSWLSDSTMRHLRDVGDRPELGERYEIIDAIAQGGMGKVYRARDRDLERDVALKVLNVARVDEDAKRRMVREARILAGLEHPGIVPIHDVGTLEDGRVYYTMKLVKGSRLDEHARAHPERIGLLRVLERICEAVAFAHAHGVIHRDLKPENVMVGSFGEVLVMDWGVAKILGEAGVDRSGGEGEAVGEVEATSGGGNVEAAGQVEATSGGGNAEAAAEAGSSGGSAQAAVEAASGGGNAEAAAEAASRADAARAGSRTTTDVRVARMSASTSAPTEAAPPNAGAKTNPGTVLGTPGYMAPEQAAGRIDAIDPRTDVYALGVILRDLLGISGGKTPRPLQALIDKATQRDQSERYVSVEQLSADIANFLSGNQVAAHRETVWERFSRIVYRFRTPIILVLVYVIIRLLIFIFAGT